MTLDDAIEHAEQMAELAKWGPLEDEYQQQLDWLKELKRLRAVQDIALANMRAANLESEQLKSENASLRGAAMGLGELCDQLKEENKKLRELVEVLVNCGRKYHTMGGSCPMFNADAEADDFCGAVQAARELGIEVE